MSLLKQMLSVEDITEAEYEVPEVVAVSDDEVHEAEAAVADVKDELREEVASIDEVKRLEAEIEETQASVEHFIDILEYGISQEDYSPQFAAAISFKLQSLNDVFGGDLGVPSLEDFSRDSLDVYYTHSLEGFKDVLARLNKVRKNALEALRKKTNQALGRYIALSKNYMRLLDAAYEQAAYLDLEAPVKVTASSVAKVINVKGQLPANLQNAITAFANDTYRFAELGLQDVKRINEEVKAGIVRIEQADSNDVEVLMNKLFTETTPILKSNGTILIPGNNLLGLVFEDQSSKVKAPKGLEATQSLTPFYKASDVKASGNVEIKDGEQLRSIISAARNLATAMSKTHHVSLYDLAKQNSVIDDNDELLQKVQDTAASGSNRALLEYFMTYPMEAADQLSQYMDTMLSQSAKVIDAVLDIVKAVNK